MTTTPSDMARPASVADLKLLLSALHTHGVDYLLVGGYALFALGYQRGTVDIDILLAQFSVGGNRRRPASVDFCKA